MKNQLLQFVYHAMYHGYGICRTRIAAWGMKKGQMKGRCLVLGSAPNPVIPIDFNETWSAVTVNASQASLLNYNRQPDVTVMSDRMLEDSPANTSGKEAIQNSRTRQLVLIQRGHSMGETTKTLKALHYSFERLTVIDHWTRSRITHDVLGSYMAMGSGERKISTGIFASLLAYHLGAAPVVLSGFSFTEDGHAYNSFNQKRYHILSDKRAVSRIHEKRLPFYAADRVFSLECGLPVWQHT